MTFVYFRVYHVIGISNVLELQRLIKWSIIKIIEEIIEQLVEIITVLFPIFITFNIGNETF